MRRSNICLMRNRKKEQKDSQHLDREGFPRIDERQNAQTAEAQSILISEGRREEEERQGARPKVNTQTAEEAYRQTEKTDRFKAVTT